ncbi:MAG: threonine synthase, partial [Candidatus Thiodiazotropha sp.]
MAFRSRYTGLIERYRDRLPVHDDTRIISLGEGNTPLIRLNNIPRELGKDVDIFVKYEGLNPTGSFKDRGMTMAVTKAVEEGSKAIICASTGNTSAAAAAYAARAGITAFVVIPDGKIAMGKLAQAMMYGAITIQIKGNFDDGMQLVKDVADHAPVTIVNSINPYRLQGQKTAAFEIVEELGHAPDYHCLPVGNAGNITAHWIGYSEYSCTTGDNVTA